MGVTAAAGAAPREEYAQRRRQRQAVVDRQARLDARISLGRLAVFTAGLGLAVAAYRVDALSWAWLAVPGAAFVALVLWHDRVLRVQARAQRAVDFYRRGLERLDDRWAGTGLTRADFAGDEHPYAADLDLFGRGSLFELLCGARTRAGEEALARWLLQPAPAREVRARQGAVEELRARLDLREELALLGGDLRAGVRSEVLCAWGVAAPLLPASRARALQLAALLSSLASVGGLALWYWLSTGPWPLALALLLHWGLGRYGRHRLSASCAALTGHEEELGLLAKVLGRLEREPVAAPHLVALQSALSADGARASQRLAQLARRLSWHGAQANQLFAPLAFALHWDLHFSLAVEAWRVDHGPDIGRWLEAIGELEALSDLAGYAYEHPHDPFPELVEGEARFEGEALGHPLLPAASCVRNSVSLGAGRRVLLVSGSNMSGKTTLLRTVGINAVLAQAGAPVRAGRLALSPLSVGATLRIHDSIQQGTSRFYSEIKRLQQLMEMARAGAPLLFLLDEVLHGTNSHDRRIGAEALVRGFLDRGAVGLVTTHDLALAEIVDGLGERAGNVHFADDLQDGALHFDYCMREGVVQRSNALALMRSVGLEV